MLGITSTDRTCSLTAQLVRIIVTAAYQVTATSNTNSLSSCDTAFPNEDVYQA